LNILLFIFTLFRLRNKTKKKETLGWIIDYVRFFIIEKGHDFFFFFGSFPFVSLGIIKIPGVTWWLDDGDGEEGSRNENFRVSVDVAWLASTYFKIFSSFFVCCCCFFFDSVKGWKSRSCL
jgi:hypothetical protein